MKKLCLYLYHALDMNDRQWECYLNALESLH